jgi:hypothetical protein
MLISTANVTVQTNHIDKHKSIKDPGNHISSAADKKLLQFRSASNQPERHARAKFEPKLKASKTNPV